MPTGPLSLLWQAGRYFAIAAAPANLPSRLIASRRLIMQRSIAQIRLATHPTPTAKPISAPTAEALAMMRIRVTGFLKNPRTVWVSSGSRSQSATDGLRRHASTIPTTIAVRTSGYTRAIGDASMAAITENGEPPEIAVKRPAPIEVGMIQASIVLAKLA